MDTPATNSNLLPASRLDESSPDVDKAKAITEKLCAAGRPDACMSLARALAPGKERDALEQRAHAIRRRRCIDDKMGNECFVLGVEIEGTMLAPEYRKSDEGLVFLRRGCDLRDYASCLYASANLARRGKSDEAAALRKRYLEMIEGSAAGNGTGTSSVVKCSRTRDAL